MAIYSQNFQLFSLVCMGVFMLFSTSCASSSSAAGPIKIGASPEIFLDDHLIAFSENVELKVHVGSKHQQAVLEPELPWEGERVNIFGSVHFDAEKKLFRMWYLSSLGPGYGHRAPAVRFLTGGGEGDVVLYATSKDGLFWEKPQLGVYEFDGAPNNNIVFDLHSPSVIRDDDDPDPEKRYKMLGYAFGEERSYRAAYSPDGIHWKPYPQEEILDHGDTITLTLDREGKEYLAFHKRPATIRGFPRRVIWLSRSRDFVNWTEPELVFAPDEKDDLWAREPDQRTEFYNMSVYPTGRLYLGMVSVFRVTKVVEPGVIQDRRQSRWDGPAEIELVYSHDARSWKRLNDRSPIIPVGPKGSFDEGMILGVASQPVHYEDETWVYYTGYNTPHGGTMPPKKAAIGRASWRLHGFVSMDAGDDEGLIETAAFETGGSRLILNADASHGEVAIEVLGPDGSVLPGYERRNCDPMSNTDSVRHVISWSGTQALPQSSPLRLRIFLRNARVYSFSIEP